MTRFAKKSGGYIGSDVVEKKMRDGVPIYLVYCEVDADDADPTGNEPVSDSEKIIGVTTSGAYGHAVKKSLMFAYVQSGYEKPNTEFQVRILGELRNAKVLEGAVWDPDNARLRG